MKPKSPLNKALAKLDILIKFDTVASQCENDTQQYQATKSADYPNRSKPHA